MTYTKVIIYMHEPDVLEREGELYNNTAVYRRLRIAGGTAATSLCVTLPKRFLVAIGAKNGDFLKITAKEHQMIIEKPSD